MSVAVLMGTYNGEKYIEEQMCSIVKQSRKADEVLICDDCSSDSTVDIIKKFINKHRLKNWTLIENKVNKGFAENFISGISKISADIVFFSDQDDIWHMDKIKIMTDVMKKNNAEAVLCRQKYIDSNGDRKKVFLAQPGIEDFFSSWHFRGKRCVSFEEQVCNNRSTGMALAVRRDAALVCSKWIGEYQISHDLIIGMYAASHNKMYYINESLVKRRIHDNNTSAPQITVYDRIKNMEKMIRGIEGRVKLQLICLADFWWLGECDKKELNKSVRDYSNIIRYIEEREILKLFYLLIKSNGMVNKKIICLSLLYALMEK
ncbi:glycosyltransferase [Selenomonas ruminantium]|uniref:glycosyltransferase n=1 Tax=Selenomonas ruminantium TaxID=971 RepID=UPI00094C2CB6|nr:glycosyltransferase [Selenomonas ruminantium]